MSIDIIDSRDIIEKFKNLDEEREALIDTIKELEEDEESEDYIKAVEELEEWEVENEEEYNTLKEVKETGEAEISDWEFGASLIHEDYFEEYCEELLKDTGNLPQDIPWYIVIDWEATANNIKADYTEIEYDGETYLARS